MKTLTMIIPAPLLDQANHYITCVYDLNLADLETIKDAPYNDPPSNKKYSIIHGRLTDEQYARAMQGTDLQRPSIDNPDNPKVDLTKANAGRSETIVFQRTTDAEGNPVSIRDGYFPLTKILLIPQLDVSVVERESGLILEESPA